MIYTYQLVQATVGLKLLFSRYCAGTMNNLLKYNGRDSPCPVSIIHLMLRLSRGLCAGSGQEFTLVAAGTGFS